MLHMPFLHVSLQLHSQLLWAFQIGKQIVLFDPSQQFKVELFQEF